METVVFPLISGDAGLALPGLAWLRHQVVKSDANLVSVTVGMVIYPAEPRSMPPTSRQGTNHSTKAILADDMFWQTVRPTAATLDQHIMPPPYRPDRAEYSQSVTLLPV